MDIVHPAIERYMEQLTRGDDEAVLLEMEALAKEKGFPIIGRLCGRSLEVVARSIGAKRIFELGSGYGYSAYWFSRAVGRDGEIHLCDGDERNETRARDFLGRAGLDGPITFHVGDALTEFASVEGDFDIVYCDVDKGEYPDCWAAARGRVRVGGYFICDNMLWGGRVTGEADDDDIAPGWTAAIDATNRAIFAAPDYRAWINPTRDGVIMALRTS